MVKTSKQRPSKQAEIVEIAEALFLKYGYAETTIEQLLAASGLSKGGFYHYFKSKEDVLAESIRMLMRTFLTQLEPLVMDPQLNALEKLKRFMSLKAEFQSERKNLAEYLSMLMQSDFTLYKFYLSLAQSYLEPFTQILEQGKAEGHFKIEYPRQTAELLLRAATSFPQSSLLDEYLQDKTLQRQYSLALNQLMVRALGITESELGL